MPPVFKLYDTMSKEVKPLKTVEPRHLRFYSCGPTVYSYAHIGNFRTFLTADLVVRTAEALGWKVTYVSNITDVGHLTVDDVADAEGEDKMEKALKSKEGEAFNNVWELAEFYADALVSDWQLLNLRAPQVRPKATQHMTEQIMAIEQLVKDGHAYETPTGVYFSVQSFKDYGKLSGNKDQESLYRAVREVVSDDNKRHPADFALWKKDHKHLMQWFSPYGWGFPGWHLECSVMAQQYLGDTLDLHAGGEDLIFPHHECEIAQSESLNGKPFSNHWIHTRFLQVDGKKMSKRDGTFYTVRDITDGKGADPLALRLALISGQYRQPFNFTLQTLRDAEGNVDRFRLCDQKADEGLTKNLPGDDFVGEALRQLSDEMLEAMCNDLNTPVAIAKALEGTKVILREADGLNGASAKSAKAFLDSVNKVLGIVRSDYASGPSQAKASGEDDWVEEQIQARASAKQNRDFALADKIRDDLMAKGIELRDGPEGTSWKRKLTV
ncbi:MAG: cysteine--tRNA ligase [Armatimonadetes bacterium]|nr:cysteine--tRNA ligase [Armatimonadota bacterium]